MKKTTTMPSKPAPSIPPSKVAEEVAKRNGQRNANDVTKGMPMPKKPK